MLAKKVVFAKNLLPRRLRYHHQTPGHHGVGIITEVY